MSPEHREVAELLLQRARESLAAAQTLVATEGQADNVIGFQLQQAVEKALKVMLAAREIEIPHTHNLEHLARQVEDAEIVVPAEVRSASWLTPWAIAFRYEEEEDDLDRDAALEAATAAIALAEEIVASEG